MSGRRAKDIRRFCVQYIKENNIDQEKFKWFYRQMKKDYMRGKDA